MTKVFPKEITDASLEEIAWLGTMAGACVRNIALRREDLRDGCTMFSIDMRQGAIGAGVPWKRSLMEDARPWTFSDRWKEDEVCMLDTIQMIASRWHANDRVSRLPPLHSSKLLDLTPHQT